MHHKGQVVSPLIAVIAKRPGISTNTNIDNTESKCVRQRERDGVCVCVCPKVTKVHARPSSSHSPKPSNTQTKPPTTRPKINALTLGGYVSLQLCACFSAPACVCAFRACNYKCFPTISAALRSCVCGSCTGRSCVCDTAIACPHRFQALRLHV